MQAVTAELAARGANVDRIRRLARRPVTALELDVSGVPDLADLRRDRVDQCGLLHAHPLPPDVRHVRPQARTIGRRAQGQRRVTGLTVRCVTRPGYSGSRPA